MERVTGQVNHRGHSKGQRVLIDTVSITTANTVGSTATPIAWEKGLYNEIIVRLDNYISTTGAGDAEVQLQISDDGGSTWKTSGYVHATSSATGHFTLSGDDLIESTTSGVLNGLSSEFRMWGVGDTTYHQKCHISSYYYTSGAAFAVNEEYCHHTTGTEYNAIRVRGWSGSEFNIDKLELAVYGILR